MKTGAKTSRWRLAALAVAALAFLSILGCSRPLPVPCDDPALPGSIQAALAAQPAVVSVAGDPVVSLIIRLPGVAPRGRATIFHPSYGLLPHTGLLQNPQDVLQTPGRYLAVQKQNGDFAHIVKVNAPSYLVSESGGGGAVFGTYVQYEGPSPVISTSIPFKEDGLLTIFDIGPAGSVSEVVLAIPLGSAPKALTFVLRRAS